MKFLINEELINLSKISHRERDKEHRKNIRQDLTIDKDAKATILTEKIANQIPRLDLIIS